MLLKEVHHRVKNNLMTIIGLVKMQEAKTQDESITALLQELEGRIRSMATGAREPPQVEDLSRVDLQNYIETLTRPHPRPSSERNADIHLSREGGGRGSRTWISPSPAA